MAPMEAVEGANRESEEPLPPVKPKDKIIVAFAGPLFSFGLALFSALIVMWVGKPRDVVESTTIGFVPKGGLAEKAGLQVGDEILQINGQEVDGWVGSSRFNSVREAVMLSEGEKIEFVVKRDGEVLPPLVSEFKIPPTPWYKRKQLRQVEMAVESNAVVGYVDEKGPAGKAKFEVDDRILAIDGEEIRSWRRVLEIVEGSAGKALTFKLKRGDEIVEAEVTPLVPKNATDEKGKIGIAFGDGGEFTTDIYHPGPLEQVGDSVRMMWVTLSKIVSPKSDVSIQHLSGPVGIGGVMFDMLGIEDGWRRLLWFMVLFNVNLAILNMLPFPILDGGHIVLAIGEVLAGKPVRAPLLDFVQYAFFFLLIGLFLFITTKDIGDRLGIGGGRAPTEPAWPEEAG